MNDQTDMRTYDVPSEDVTPQPQPPQSNALTVRDAVQALERPPEQPQRPLVTVAQAKIEAVANLTASAYAKASELKLTAEESAKLQEDFPDDAFKPGAAGKERLLYIEHAFLRDRLNQVFGIGQWAIIPRNRWAEDYSFKNSYGKTVEASRVYVEAMLLVRGCFVSESIGEMVYYKNNDSQNYGDAVEGAKTAALRRCCKELGVGLQAWKKDWGDGWWQRHPTGKPGTAPRTPATPPQAPSAPPQGSTQRTGAPPPSQGQSDAPQGEVTYPAVRITDCRVAHAKTDPAKPDEKPKWTAYFLKFDDGFGSGECATFDKKLGALAQDLASTGETARLVTEPGKKPNTRAIVSLTRAEAPPETPECDTMPPEYDEPPTGSN